MAHTVTLDALAATVALRTRRDGGITIDLQGIEATAGYAVSVAPDRTRAYDSLTMSDVGAWIASNRDALIGDGAYVGAWHDGAYAYMDVTKIAPSLARAASLALAHGQRAIYCYATRADIAISGDSPHDTALNVLQVIDRLQRDARERGDCDALRRALRVALAFGRCSVQTPVSRSEAYALDYLHTGNAPKFHAYSLARISEWLDSADLCAFASGDAESRLVALTRDVYGIGPAKASFALALAGFDALACLDSNILAHYRGDAFYRRVELSWCAGNPVRRVAKYLQECARIYGDASDARAAQWRDFAALVPEYASDGHSRILARVLDAYV